MVCPMIKPRLSQRLLLVLMTCLCLAVPADHVAADEAVRVGIYDYTPFVVSQPDGAVDGLYIRVLEHIARKEGWRLAYVYGTWGECLERLEAGRIDLLVAIAFSEARSRRFDFSSETFLTNWGQVYRRKGVDIESFSDLAGKSVAVYREGIFSEALRRILGELGIESQFVEQDTYEAIARLTAAGRVDAGVLNRIYGLQLENHPDLIRTDIIFMPTELRFAAPKGKSGALLATIDRHLKRLKADKASVYHEALSAWSISRVAAIAERRWIPTWMVYGLIGAVGLTLLFLGSSLLLKHTVKLKTVALTRKNEELQREVEERRRTEAALTENERRLATLTDNLPGMVYRSRCDDVRSLIFVSSGSQELLGYGPDELMKHMGALKAVIHPDDFGILSRLPEAEADTTSPASYRHIYRLQTRNGGFKWVCDYGTRLPAQGEGGDVLEGFITDVTQQQEAEIRLRRENDQLRSAIREMPRFGDIVGKSTAMKEVYGIVLRAAACNDPVIVYGESGTGKELIAREIHRRSERSEGRFVPVNCGAIPENLMESEFFGHMKGAFSGADADKAGFMDIADGGTLFLDEIGDIPLNMQVKLLRAIEGGGYMAVGGTTVRQPDIRIVAATNKNLKQLVSKGRIREDFYYRIHVIPIFLPPLRNRKEDIPLLIEHFLEKYDSEKVPPITGNLVEALKGYHWPGNIRELRNVLNRYVTLKQLDLGGGTFRAPAPPAAPADGEHKPDDISAFDELKPALEAFEKAHIERALQHTDWHRGQAAALLGINRKTLFKKIQVYHIKKERHRSSS